VYDDGGFGVAGNGVFDGSDAPVPGVVVAVYLDLTTTACRSRANWSAPR